MKQLNSWGGNYSSFDVKWIIINDKVICKGNKSIIKYELVSSEQTFNGRNSTRSTKVHEKI